MHTRLHIRLRIRLDRPASKAACKWVVSPRLMLGKFSALGKPCALGKPSAAPRLVLGSPLRWASPLRISALGWASQFARSQPTWPGRPATLHRVGAEPPAPIDKPYAWKPVWSPDCVEARS
eukprot:323298-Chlamydomonas_euryale.AAC.4